MRKLTEQEFDQVKKTIAAKNLTSAEILVEIYDHYVSHLEGFEEADFEKELFELEQKFTYSYCHSLQTKFIKASKKEVGKMHWKVIQRNLHLPRIIYILACISVCSHLLLYKFKLTDRKN
ncbi:hypothetical protein SYJ56_14055 [Algoriphagus sp. D3-2-R+10]|uniref:hypothetical protein n=1 Tax=Algoriphagus aurantiacus TaxID=3103948 RepID=UPI002B3EA54D|nr:hypothetical protein [Algoriphagus sp. D3-2-R+10]MEB2776442.1 hypothetical protein [Algoriphagus sp. D3-2-R+10]